VRFFSSWTLTRGEGWRLFGMAWLLVLVIVGVSIVYAIISSIINAMFTAGAMVSILGAGGATPPDPSAFITHLPALLLASIPGLIMGAAFQGVVLALFQSPWVEVYRELAGTPEVATTFS
jgi:hypothetical protein